MDAELADWLRFVSIALAAVNLGFLGGVTKAYSQAVRFGDKALKPLAQTLAVLAIGLALVFTSIAWRNVQLLGTPVTLPLFILPVGYCLTLYGFFRLRRGVLDRIKEYTRPANGRHGSKVS